MTPTEKQLVRALLSTSRNKALEMALDRQHRRGPLAHLTVSLGSSSLLTRWRP